MYVCAYTTYENRNEEIQYIFESKFSDNYSRYVENY